MTFDEMMEKIKEESPEARETIEKAELIADFLFKNDYVQVVRCKNCIHYMPTGKGFGWCAQDNVNNQVHDWFFCFLGEEDDFEYEEGDGPE